MIAIFVWTFSGVMDAIALGLVILMLAVLGLLVAWVRLVEWWEKRGKKPGRETGACSADASRRGQGANDAGATEQIAK